MRDGFTYVRRTKPLRALMVLTPAPAMFSMPRLLLPAFVKQGLGGGAQDSGVLMSAYGVGALIGSLLVVVRADAGSPGRTVLVAALSCSLSFILVVFTRSMALAGVLLAVSGFFQTVLMAMTQMIV